MSAAERRREVKRGRARSTPSPAFQPDAFYEQLIAMRAADPAALLRFGKDTVAALQAYEAAKREAGETKKGGKK